MWNRLANPPSKRRQFESELVLTVGTGTATKADKVTVRWPGSTAGTETRTNLDAGAPHVLKQGEAK